MIGGGSCVIGVGSCVTGGGACVMGAGARITGEGSRTVGGGPCILGPVGCAIGEVGRVEPGTAGSAGNAGMLGTERIEAARWNSACHAGTDAARVTAESLASGRVTGRAGAIGSGP